MVSSIAFSITQLLGTFNNFFCAAQLSNSCTPVTIGVNLSCTCFPLFPSLGSVKEARGNGVLAGRQVFPRAQAP